MASQSSGSATGNPRNKVALKPGHSLMDWIRLGSSGADLSGTGGRLLDVSPAELAKHREPHDVWLAIRGKVYNVSRYLDFHPGGVEELLRGAASDATRLFNSVHPWVNYESLLKKCLVGNLVVAVDSDIFSSPGENSKQTPETKGIAAGSEAVNSTKPSSSPTRTDWYQQKESVSLVIYTANSSSEVLVDGREEGELWVRVGSGQEPVGWKVAGRKVGWPPLSVVSTSTKVEVKLPKETSLDSPLARLLSPPEILSPAPARVSITSLERLTHNVYLIKISVLDRVHYHIPIGYHLIFSASVKGVDVERSYTPVERLGEAGGSGIQLVVKRYESGLMSSHLTYRKPQDNVLVLACRGAFALPSHLPPGATLLLLAAGTGLTPFLRIINWAVHALKQCFIKLVFFNKTEKDIIWEDEFKSFATKHAKFSVSHVLSSAGSGWTGLRGYTSPGLLQSFLPHFTPDQPHLFYTCVCGPVSFTQLNQRYLEDLGYSTEHYFCFKG